MEIISGDVAIEVTCTAVREKHGKEPDRFDRDKLYLQGIGWVAEAMVVAFEL